MIVTAVSRHLLAAFCVFIACAAAQPAIAQPVMGGTLSNTIATAEQLTPEQVEEIRKYVNDSLALFTSDVPDESRIGRDRLAAPLAVEGVSTAFRLRYSELLEQPLSRLVTGDDDRLAFNALRLAGMCASARTVSMLTTGMTDKRPSVRYGATVGLSEMLRVADRNAAALNEQRLNESLDRLSAAIASDESMMVAEGAVLALDAPRLDIGLRARAADRLVQGLAKRLDALRATPPAAADAAAAAQLAVRGIDALRVLLIDPAASANLSPDFVKRSAVTGGKAVGYAAARLAAAPAGGLGTDESSALASAVGASDVLMIIALGSLQPSADSVQTTLQGAFTSAVQGTGDFRAAADLWIGAKGRLLSAPVSARAADFN